MSGYFVDISPGSAEGRSVWVSSDGQIAAGMAVFYVGMGKTVIGDVFAFLDERVSTNDVAPTLDDLWHEINERIGDILVNFRLTLIDVRSGQPQIRTNGSEPLIGFFGKDGEMFHRFVADCQSLSSEDKSRFMLFCGEISVDALEKISRTIMTITNADDMRDIVIEATESTDWAAVIFPT